MRLFFALWPTDAERFALATWQPPLWQICGGRAVRTDQLHATLVFLGNVALHHLEELQLIAQAVEGASFDLVFDAALYFAHNRIVYAAPSAIPQQLTELVQSLEHQLTAHRFVFDQRSYKPHVTLFRSAKVNDALLPTLPAVKWHAHDFALVQSLPDKTGTSYQALSRFPLR